MNAKESDTNPVTGLEFQRVSGAAPLGWLAAGWREFRSAPVPSLLYGLLFANLATLVLWSSRSWPGLAISFATGLMLVGQFLAVGLYAGARQHERNRSMEIRDAMRTLGSRAVNLGLFALTLGLIVLIWVRISSVLFAIQYAAFEPSVAAYLDLLGAEGRLGVTLFFIGLGFVLALAVFVTSAVAAPMIVDINCNPLQAMYASVKVFAANPLPMLIWAALIVGLSMLGILPFFVGMWVLFPVLGYASWHSYRATVKVERAATG